MSTGGGIGQPNFFQCSKCRRNKPWHPKVDPAAYRKGLLTRIELTGLTKAIGDGRANGRSTNTRIQYKCLDCGHVGWTRHISVFYKAVDAGIETPGEDSTYGRRKRYLERKKRRE